MGTFTLPVNKPVKTRSRPRFISIRLRSFSFERDLEHPSPTTRKRTIGSPYSPFSQRRRRIFGRDYVSLSYNFKKEFSLFYSIGDFSVCLLVFALPVLPVRSLPPAIHPSDPGTTTRESPMPPVLVGRPRCTGRDFDEIFRAASQVPPWTSQAACGSSQTFSHPFLQC
jgi:hypothetical protein